MLNGIDNTLQIIVLLACVAVALVRALRRKSRTWTLLSLFLGSMVLGNLYWTFCLLFFKTAPQVSAVSDLSWYAAYIFLYMLLRHAAPPGPAREHRMLPWLCFLFTLGMGIWFCTFYIQWNEEQVYSFILWDKAVSNLAYALLMGLLLFSAIRRLMNRKKYLTQRPLCIVILAFCLLEYALWTASCLWEGESLANPYYWFDFLMTLCFILFLPATRKAVKV